MGGIVSAVFGSGGSKRQAEATLKSAEMQAAADREAVRGNTLAMQTQIAQKRASDQAAELLSTPQEAANVILSPETDEPDVDPVTGRRRTTRSRFFNNYTGLNI
ncbi:MAG: hypothetical protein HRU32_17670 [Rhodobacteraceae bacterium]|nr:hypothetical protein [Paracoccaceae bacterium]